MRSWAWVADAPYNVMSFHSGHVQPRLPPVLPLLFRHVILLHLHLVRRGGQKRYQSEQMLQRDLLFQRDLLLQRDLQLLYGL